jgi:magnesium chelatase subunit H
MAELRRRDKTLTEFHRTPETALLIAFVTMDSHLAGAAAVAEANLRKTWPGLRVELHSADQWAADAAALKACHAAIAKADIVVATMLFLEDHTRLVAAQLAARRDSCDAMFCALSAADIVKQTKLGRLDMSNEPGGAMGMLKKLKGKRQGNAKISAGESQMRMLRNLPKILRFIPGTAQDLRIYFLGMQYWLAGSAGNFESLVRLMVHKYAAGDRASLRTGKAPPPPIEYPDMGVYHPRAAGRIVTDAAAIPHCRYARGTIGILLLRSYILAEDTAHYDGVISAIEVAGYNVLPIFAVGLDQRNAVQTYFMRDGVATVDAVVSLTGFSLVGGPAYNDSAAAEVTLAALDVPYVVAAPLEFQTIEDWESDARGMTPIEATLMVALPELDGATLPMVFGGRRSGGGTALEQRRMCVHPERAAKLAARLDRLAQLRKAKRAERKIGIVLFNFPPNAGATGTAAYLSVFASLHNTLHALREAGYAVDVPDTVDSLRDAILKGNAEKYGTPANVGALVARDTHIRRETYLPEIEKVWGPAPGRQLADGNSIFVMGQNFGNVFVGVQPPFGYEGDPMRLLFEGGFAPTHAFSAFYRYLSDDFGAHAVLHFGTHGALEFMPGKQAGLSAKCWPDRLIGTLPNFYLYAANNPSEGLLAKRRGLATLISHLTPPVGAAGLYKGLVELKSSLGRARGLAPDAPETERLALAELVQAQAGALDFCPAEPPWADPANEMHRLSARVLELEYTLIPEGLHIVGQPPDEAARTRVMDAAGITDPAERARIDALMATDSELPGIITALDGKYIRPAPGGDLLKTPAVLPTGRNLYGFDPFRMPTEYAVKDGAKQAEKILARHAIDVGGIPETIALMLWGADNLKSEGAPLAQGLWLLGAEPRRDGYGRLCGAQLVPLAVLGRPRVDVIITLSGIFRDLLPMQTRLLAEAALLAAQADEPVSQNFVRKHVLEFMAAKGGTIEDAALRVFSNQEGSYGANVNNLIESGAWNNEDELGRAYMQRKGFAYGVNGKAARNDAVLTQVLGTVEAAYQNLESLELGVTSVDHYFDGLGGLTKAVSAVRGNANKPALYIGDQTRGEGLVRTLNEQVALEMRTRTLNPKYIEDLLVHGHEGVRQLESQVTNTLGWSATTGAVDPWVYKRITETFVLDKEMRERLAKLNPTASARLTNRLIEAHDRKYWAPDAATLEALMQAGEELEDRLEGIEMAA